MNIEYGIPIPKRRSVTEGRWTRLVKTMKSGGSLRLDSRGEATALASAIKATGARAIVRKVKEEGQIYFRVWRDEEPENEL